MIWSIKYFVTTQMVKDGGDGVGYGGGGGDQEDDRLRDSLLSDLQLALAQPAPSPELGAAATHVPSCNIQV